MATVNWGDIATWGSLSFWGADAPPESGHITSAVPVTSTITGGATT